MNESDSSPRILIVDESRMARVMLLRQIRSHYGFREEANGELAWQALVSDPSIQAVVCSLSMPVLNGDELLARMRASALSQIAQMPVLLIVGDNADAVERAKSHGATDFIDRQALTTDLLVRIDAMLKGSPSHAGDGTAVESGADATPGQASKTSGAALDSAAEVTGAVDIEHPPVEETITLQTVAGISEPSEFSSVFSTMMVTDVTSAANTVSDAHGETFLLSKEALVALAKQTLRFAKEKHDRFSTLVMEFDGVADLHERHGDDVVWQLQRRFAAILSSRVRENDGLGRYVGDRLAIISPGLGSVDCEAFSNRLRKAIKKAKISAHGKRLNLSVSVGIGSFPVDEVTSAEALLELASCRLDEAQAAGGDRVIAADVNPAKKKTLTVEQALSLLEIGEPDKVAPHLPALGHRLIPLLKLLDRELKLGLSLSGAIAKLQTMMRSQGNTLNAPKIDAQSTG